MGWAAALMTALMTTFTTTSTTAAGHDSSRPSCHAVMAVPQPTPARPAPPHGRADLFYPCVLPPRPSILHPSTADNVNSRVMCARLRVHRDGRIFSGNAAAADIAMTDVYAMCHDLVSE